MAKKLMSDREKRLQKLLIPLNIVVCVLALVAMLTLFLTPILKIDVGKIMHDKGVIEYIDDTIEDAVGEAVKDQDQTVDFKPVVTNMVKNVLGGAEGQISVSAVSALKVLTGSGNKAEIVMDEMLFGEDALVTALINSIVDAVGNLFETEEGKKVIEDAAVIAFANALYKDMDTDGTHSQKFTDEKVQSLTGIMRDLSDPSKVPDGKVDDIANRFVDEVDDILGSDVTINESNRQEIVDEIQKIYDTTLVNLKEGETVSIESIICVAVSDNMNLSDLNLDDLIGSIFDDEEESNGEGSVHIKAAEDEVETPDGADKTETPDGGDKTETPDVGLPDGGNGGGTSTEGEEKVIVTNYNDLLAELGFGEEEKEDLKGKLRTKLNDGVNKIISDNGIDDYFEYYGYVFYAMLVFMLPWFVLFLFAFFRIFTKNKRFMTWYVKLFGWIPAVIWLALKLVPILADKFLSDTWNGEEGPLIQGLLGGISTYTWISGLCYVLLWLVSIFWAFPIKHKIRKERKHPAVTDAETSDDGIDEI